MRNNVLVAIVKALSFCMISNCTIETPPYFITTRSIDPLFLGMSITGICYAKVFSIRYGIPFYYVPSDLDPYFKYPFLENSLEKISNYKDYQEKYLVWDDILTDNFINTLKTQKTHFFIWGDTVIDRIEPQWVDEGKKLLQLQNIPSVNKLPEDCLTIAVHIRKGNGGFVHVYDGKMVSEQLFDHDKSKVKYIPFKDWLNYPFEPECIRRDANGCLVSRKSFEDVQHAGEVKLPVPFGSGNHSNLDEMWTLKFPPEQYYIDQINWLIDRLKSPSLFIQIFTDDKNPIDLIERIKSRVDNKSKNVIFYYYDNRSTSTDFNDYKGIIIEDLYNISRFSIFIRGQSYYARAAELMSNHAVVMYPVEWRWEKENSKAKSIMSTIVIKANDIGISLFK